MSFGIAAAGEGVLEPYRPTGWDDIPEGLKDPEGMWHTVHSGTLGFSVNVEPLDGLEIPRCWADLGDAQYRGMVGHLDPSSAFVGYAGAVAVNRALGGDLENFGPAIVYYQELRPNDPIVPLQTASARVVSGEIPILLDYDFNAYRAEYDEGGAFEFVIPCEGTIVVPYVMGLVAGAPNPEAGRRVLDFILSDEGQAIWTNAYLRPAREVALPEELATRFLPPEDYARAEPLDYVRMAEAQEAFGERYRDEVN